MSDDEELFFASDDDVTQNDNEDQEIENDPVDNDLEEEYVPDLEEIEEDKEDEEEPIVEDCELEFDSDVPDEIDDDGEKDDDDDDDDENAEFNEEQGDGIDIAEIYNDGPKKKVGKAIFVKRKKSKPKISKLIKKKKKSLDDIVVPTYLQCDIRDKCKELLSMHLEDENSRNLERSIWNYTIRTYETNLGKKLKKSNLEESEFKESYTNTIREIFPQLTNGNTDYLIQMLSESKVCFSSTLFEKERFKDDQETKYIETPPTVAEGDAICRECKKKYTESLKEYATQTVKEEMPDEEDDEIIEEAISKKVKSKKFNELFVKNKNPPSYRKTTFYQIQMRSADEPMSNFFTCVTCGNQWKS